MLPRKELKDEYLVLSSSRSRLKSGSLKSVLLPLLVLALAALLYAHAENYTVYGKIKYGGNLWKMSELDFAVGLTCLV